MRFAYTKINNIYWVELNLKTSRSDKTAFKGKKMKKKKPLSKEQEEVESKSGNILD